MQKVVGMYNCGPTVYNYAHLGNLRAYVFADTLRRTLEYFGYKVKQIINVTDIGHLSSDADSGEDKMTKALIREGKPLTLKAMRDVANFYFKTFKEDLARLNILPAHKFPFASDHIKEDIALIERLAKKGLTYSTSDGVYFDTGRSHGYGKLGRLSPETGTEARIAHNAEKRHLRDFALWKFNDSLGYPAPFGKGFPGWHVECSAMSMKYLGETFDIHTGGVDHIPVHHNNEIAQSESATGKEFARVWMHSAFLNISGEKMAKSEENFLRLHSLEENKIPALAYRYFLLTGHYRTPLTYSEEGISAADTALKNLYREFDRLPSKKGSVSEEYRNRFAKFIKDDINTPQALALLWELVGDKDIHPTVKRATILSFDKVFGFGLENRKKLKIPPSIATIARERNKARAKKDWALSDKLREDMKKLGYAIEDTPGGETVYPI